MWPCYFISLGQLGGYIVFKLFLWCRAGCTALHWAAIRGNLEVCTVLVHTGTKEELTLEDSGGLTPVQLAAEKGHRHLSNILVRFRWHSIFLLIINLFLLLRNYAACSAHTPVHLGSCCCNWLQWHVFNDVCFPLFYPFLSSPVLKFVLQIFVWCVF